MGYYWRSQGGEGAAYGHVPTSERERKSVLELGHPVTWVVDTNWTGDPERSVGVRNAEDSDGYTNVAAEELYPVDMPLMAPNVWARTSKGSTLKTVSREASSR